MRVENNKRIVKNTFLLYIRMLLGMGVSLYTSRIVLNILGVEDFGIYNVVGGFVSMMGFLNNAMANATQRFLSFEIGLENPKKLRDVFSMSVLIHFLIALFIIIIAETIGLWFVNHRLIIPADRITASLWVYQFSILALIVSIISVPYNSIIIAHERMGAFAWIGVLDVSLKLFAVFMLQWFGFDKLKFYAILLFSVSLIIRLFYGIYCKRNFKESKFHFFWNKRMFSTLINFAGWNLWGNIAGVIMGQGINVLLNMFFGPLVNAAYSISLRVKDALNQFVSNFQMAMNPQIIKSYASNDMHYMHSLIFSGSKFSFYLLLTLALPVLLETNAVLNLWLKEVPDYTVIFTRLSIVYILIDSISKPLMTAAQASGKIKLYQAVVGGLLILNLPASYLFLKFGYYPEITLLVSIAISLIAFLARTVIVASLVQLNIFDFFKNVLLKLLLVTLVAMFLPLIILKIEDASGVRFVCILLLSLISTVFSIYYVGVTRKERSFINKNIRKRLNRIK